MTLQTRTLPMFPLGTVLLPHGVLPLHIFEPRYRAMVADVLASDGQFGVVLISRGSETGGGEVRTVLGTVAQVQEHESFEDGRSALIAVGAHRLEVAAWLPDDPYPKAEVIDLLELPWTEEASTSLAKGRASFEELFNVALAQGRVERQPDLSLATDDEVAAWQLVDLSPIGPLDRQRLLETLDPVERLDLLAALLDDIRGDLERSGGTT